MGYVKRRSPIQVPLGKADPFITGILHEGPMVTLVSTTDIETANNTDDIQIVVRYEGQNGLDIIGSTLDNDDLSLFISARSITLPLTLVSVDVAGDGPVRMATYSVSPNGGTWIDSFNGNHFIQAAEGQVLDSNGNASIAGTLGSVAIDVFGTGIDLIPPVPTLNTALPTSIPTAGTFDFNITIDDTNSGVDRSTLLAGFAIEAPNGDRTILTNQTLNPVTNALSLTGDWRFDFSGYNYKQNGDYKLFALSSIQDVAGNAIAQTELGTLKLEVEELIFSGDTVAQAGQAVKARVTSPGPYRVDWGDSTESNQSNYVDHDFTDAAASHQVRIFSPDPTAITQVSIQGSLYSTVGNASKELTGLIELNYSDNQIANTPVFQPEWRALKRLLFSGNQITGIPIFHPEWSNLFLLRFQDNQITGTPVFRSEWRDLNNIWFYNNQILNSPEFPPEWVNLSEILFYDNQIQDTPEFPPEWVNLRRLWFSGNQITGTLVFPREWVNLENLWFFDNPITVMPTFHPEWVNLRRLWGSGTLSSDIPVFYPQWRNLLLLRFHDNQMTNSPEFHPEWDKLTEIWFYGNPIQDTPVFHPEWVGLSSIRFGGNLITIAPVMHPTWGLLKTVMLQSCQIADLNPLYAGLIAAGNPTPVTGRVLTTDGNPGSPGVTAGNLGQVNTIAGWAVNN